MLKTYPTAVLERVQSPKKLAVPIPASSNIKRGRPRKNTTPGVAACTSQIQKKILKTYPPAVSKRVSSPKKVAVSIPASPSTKQLGRPRKKTVPDVVPPPSQIVEIARRVLANKLYRPGPLSRKKATVVETILTEEESPEIVNPPKQVNILNRKGRF